MSDIWIGNLHWNCSKILDDIHNFCQGLWISYFLQHQIELINECTRLTDNTGSDISIDIERGHCLSADIYWDKQSLGIEQSLWQEIKTPACPTLASWVKRNSSDKVYQGSILTSGHICHFACHLTSLNIFFCQPGLEQVLNIDLSNTKVSWLIKY